MIDCETCIPDGFILCDYDAGRLAPGRMVDNCASGVGAGIRRFSGSPGRRWVLSTFNYETAYFTPSTRYRSERVRW